MENDSNRINLQHLKKVQKNRQYRLSHDSAIIQGKKNFYELYHKLSLKNILALESETIPNDVDPCLIHFVTESILKQITGLPSPEGILAEIHVKGIFKRNVKRNPRKSIFKDTFKAIHVNIYL